MKNHTEGVALARLVGVCTMLGLTLGVVAHAQAFCGFFVGGVDSRLYANATRVVLMRDGTRTVLSMQNNYQGPSEQFALVVPVPSVLTQDQVKTLPKDVFSRVDALGAPRLVEYWESDPCQTPSAVGPRATFGMGVRLGAAAASVKVEATFAVGEYNVMILSAGDSTELESWLHENQYNIPTGAADVLAPYVSAGTKFFVAKVDPSRVQFAGGQAALSPLRFYYDTPEFSLPVRLGLLNSQGSQDLIVNILAPARYEVANHANVTIPTNLRVRDETRTQFGGFYEGLFSKLVEQNPGSVVTEYAWAAKSCDPCPAPALLPSELATLGADVVVAAAGSTSPENYILTRLHYRYTKDSLGDDLVFRVAPSLNGGTGVPAQDGSLSRTMKPDTSSDSTSTFQGRYVILHPWSEALACATPMRGKWGGANGSTAPTTQTVMDVSVTGVMQMPAPLNALLLDPVPELGLLVNQPAAGASANDRSATAGASGRASATFGGDDVAGASGAPTATQAGAKASERPAPARGGCSCSGIAPQTAPVRSLGSAVAVVALCLRRRRRR